MLAKEFQGVLSKLNDKNKDRAFTQLSIKHSSQFPDFFDTISPIFAEGHIKHLVDSPEKAKVSLSTNIKTVVEFDEVEFDATLVSVQMTKKEKKGEVSYDCEMKFEKEINADNQLLGTAYLNNKEENEDGKKKLVLYGVTVTKKED